MTTKIEVEVENAQMESLRRVAEQRGQSVDGALRNAIERFLHEELRRELLVAQLRAAADDIASGVPPGVTPEEIEREITEASREYWANQRATPGR